MRSPGIRVCTDLKADALSAEVFGIFHELVGPSNRTLAVEKQLSVSTTNTAKTGAQESSQGVHQHKKNFLGLAKGCFTDKT